MIQLNGMFIEESVSSSSSDARRLQISATSERIRCRRTNPGNIPKNIASNQRLFGVCLNKRVEITDAIYPPKNSPKMSL